MTASGLLGEAAAGHEAVDIALARVLLRDQAPDLPGRVSRYPGALLSLVTVVVNLTLRLAGGPCAGEAAAQLHAGLLADYFRTVLLERACSAAPETMATHSADRVCDLVLALVERREALAPLDLETEQSAAALLVLLDVLTEELGFDRTVTDLCWLQLKHAASVRGPSSDDHA